jgi:hypothetical protein
MVEKDAFWLHPRSLHRLLIQVLHLESLNLHSQKKKKKTKKTTMKVRLRDLTLMREDRE